MANKRDYYEVLGVDKNATEDDIKRAYRRKAKECHPDLHPNDKEAEARFKELNEANEVLSDANKRARYDQFGFEDPMAGMGGGGNPFGGFDFGGKFFTDFTDNRFERGFAGLDFSAGKFPEEGAVSARSAFAKQNLSVLFNNGGNNFYHKITGFNQELCRGSS